MSRQLTIKQSITSLSSRRLSVYFLLCMPVNTQRVLTGKPIHKSYARNHRSKATDSFRLLPSNGRQPAFLSRKPLYAHHSSGIHPSWLVFPANPTLLIYSLLIASRLHNQTVHKLTDCLLGKPCLQSNTNSAGTHLPFVEMLTKASPEKFLQNFHAIALRF